MDSNGTFLYSRPGVTRVLESTAMRGHICSCGGLCGGFHSIGGIAFSTLLTNCVYGPSTSDCSVSQLGRRCNTILPGFANRTSRLVGGTTLFSGLYSLLRVRLGGDNRLSLFGGVRVPLTGMLNSVRLYNFSISLSKLGTVSRRLNRHVSIVRGRVCSLIKCRFGLGSPGRLNITLFRGLKLPTGGGAGDNCSAGTRILRSLGSLRPTMDLLLRCHALTGLGSACASNLRTYITRSNEVRAAFGRARAHANHVDSLRPGLRGVPIEADRNGHLERFFITNSNGLLISTSCSRVRLQMLTDVSNSRGVVSTFGDNTSVRATATTRIFKLPTSVMAPVLHDHTGTIGFNVICNVNTFSLTGSVNIDQGRTSDCVGSCLTACPGISDCVRGAVGSTGLGKCIAALFNEGHCLPRLTGSGTVIHTFNRHITHGTPVRNATTSVVGLTVIGIFGHLRGRIPSTGLVLRIRSRLVIRYLRTSTGGIYRVLGRRVRATTSVTIGLDASTGFNGG